MLSAMLCDSGSFPRAFPRHALPRKARPMVRRPWDTDALRAKARAVFDWAIAIIDDPDQGDLHVPANMMRSWRIQRIVRRYPEVATMLDKLAAADQTPARYVHQPRAASKARDTGRREAREERAERRQRRGMGEREREERALANPVYGTISASAEREAQAIATTAKQTREGLELIARALWWKGEALWNASAVCERTMEPLSGAWVDAWTVRTGKPRSGRAAPDSPYVKVQRYPRAAALRAWYRILNGGKPCKWELVTIANRKARFEKRRLRAMQMAIADMSADQLAALAAKIAAMQAA